jgi:phage gp29-like protein
MAISYLAAILSLISNMNKSPKKLPIINNAIAVKKPSAKQKAVNNIAKPQTYRSQSDAKRLRLAVAAAESIYSYNRDQLYRIYQEIDTDPHLTSVVESRKIKATSKDFKLVSTKGTKKKENEEAKKFFEGSWFPQFLTYAWESITYGYSLIQIEGIDDKGNITDVSLVPRPHVKPQLGIYVKNPGDITGYEYADDPWLVGIGKKDNLGLYLKVALDVLYKQHSKAAWAQFVELFGMPLRIGKVNGGDPESMKSMYDMLENMGAAGFGVMDKNDEVEFQQSSASGNGATHQLLVAELDSQVSKAIYGQTMTTDNGSSRSQSEVHERVADERSDSDHQLLAFYINDHLIPKMIELGLPLQNLKFEWETVEDNSQLFDRAIALMGQGYAVDPEWITATFDIPVIGKTDATEASESEDDTEDAQQPEKPTEEPEKAVKE